MLSAASPADVRVPERATMCVRAFETARERRADASCGLRRSTRSRRRRLSRAARRRPHDRRRLSVVHRLGARHVHRAPRAVPRDAAASPRRGTSSSSGRVPCPRACCRTASRIAATRPSSTPSTRRCGTSSRRVSCSTRRRPARSGERARRRPASRLHERGRGDRGGLRGRHAIRHPHGRRRPARGGRARSCS